MPTLLLLTLSNIFMTTAWYWHLKGGPMAAEARPIGWVILISWLLAGVEYTLAVPANRLGYESGWTPAQLKIAQEAIALTVFGVFMVIVLGQPVEKCDEPREQLRLIQVSFLPYRLRLPLPRRPLRQEQETPWGPRPPRFPGRLGGACQARVPRR